MERGKVTVLKTLPGEAPRDRAASSRFGSTAERTAAMVMKEMGK